MAALERRVQVLFDPEQYAALEREATRERTSVGAFIRDAVSARLRVSRSDRETAWARLVASADEGLGVGAADELARELGEGLDEQVMRKAAQP